MIDDDEKKNFEAQESVSPSLTVSDLEKHDDNLRGSLPKPVADKAEATNPEKIDVEASRPASIKPTLVKVPRSQRRGLFGRFTILAEVEKPKEYPRPVKWFITFVIAMAAIVAPLGSTLVFRKRITHAASLIIPNSSVQPRFLESLKNSTPPQP